MSAMQQTVTAMYKDQRGSIATNVHVTSQAHYPAKVTGAFSEECWQLDNRNLSSRAYSCLICPQIGDLVLCVDYFNNNKKMTSILAILERNNKQENTLSVPKKHRLRIETSEMDIVASKDINITSAQDVALNAPAGSVTITASELLQNIQRNLIQLCNSLFCRSKEQHFEAEQLLKTHARHQIITADKEVRMNGERINMG